MPFYFVPSHSRALSFFFIRPLFHTFVLSLLPSPFSPCLLPPFLSSLIPEKCLGLQQLLCVCVRVCVCTSVHTLILDLVPGRNGFMTLTCMSTVCHRNCLIRQREDQASVKACVRACVHIRLTRIKIKQVFLAKCQGVEVSHPAPRI